MYNTGQVRSNRSDCSSSLLFLTVRLLNESSLAFKNRVQEGATVLQQRHAALLWTHKHGSSAIELPSPAGLRCLPQMAPMSVQTEAGCYNGPYLTEGLVFSGAKTPFSHGQLGGR